MATSPTSLVFQLTRDEGYSPTVYLDSLGYQTIGTGILVDPKKGGGLRPEEGAFILNNRIQVARDYFWKNYSWFRKLERGGAREGAILNMAHQLGIRFLDSFVRMRDWLEKDDYAKAAEEFLNSKVAREQTPERAKRQARQLKEGVWV